MKTYKIDIKVTYGGGIYDGDEYHDLRVREDKEGEWVKLSDVKKLESKMARMQARIDKLEGRAEECNEK